MFETMQFARTKESGRERKQSILRSDADGPIPEVRHKEVH